MVFCNMVRITAWNTNPWVTILILIDGFLQLDAAEFTTVFFKVSQSLF